MFSLTLGSYLWPYHPLESVRTVALTPVMVWIKICVSPCWNVCLNVHWAFCAPNTSVMNGLNPTSFKPSAKYSAFSPMYRERGNEMNDRKAFLQKLLVILQMICKTKI